MTLPLIHKRNFAGCITENITIQTRNQTPQTESTSRKIRRRTKSNIKLPQVKIALPQETIALPPDPNHYSSKRMQSPPPSCPHYSRLGDKAFNSKSSDQKMVEANYTSTHTTSSDHNCTSTHTTSSIISHCTNKHRNTEALHKVNNTST